MTISTRTRTKNLTSLEKAHRLKARLTARKNNATKVVKASNQALKNLDADIPTITHLLKVALPDLLLCKYPDGRIDMPFRQLYKEVSSDPSLQHKPSETDLKTILNKDYVKNSVAGWEQKEMKVSTVGNFVAQKTKTPTLEVIKERDFSNDLIISSKLHCRITNETINKRVARGASMDEVFAVIGRPHKKDVIPFGYGRVDYNYEEFRVSFNSERRLINVLEVHEY